jgi:hypothetical protein
MAKSDVVNQLYFWGSIQIRLHREIGIKEKELKALRKELKETDKEMFALRSTKEYEEIYSKGK